MSTDIGLSCLSCLSRYLYLSDYLSLCQSLPPQPVQREHLSVARACSPAIQLFQRGKFYVVTPSLIVWVCLSSADLTAAISAPNELSLSLSLSLPPSFCRCRRRRVCSETMSPSSRPPPPPPPPFRPHTCTFFVLCNRTDHVHGHVPLILLSVSVCSFLLQPYSPFLRVREARQGRYAQMMS